MYIKFFLDLNRYEDGLIITAHSLDRNIDRMYDIMKQLIIETNFDNVDKLKTIIYAVSICQLNKFQSIVFFFFLI